MRNRKITGILICFIMICVVIAGVLMYRNSKKRNTLEEDLLKIEEALGDDYQKQSVTTIAATLTYGNPDNAAEIHYHIFLRVKSFQE